MKTKICIFGMVLLALISLSGSAFGTIYTIHPDGSGDFATVQAAVDSAVDGDLIELTDGSFSGRGNKDISYAGKAITIRSQSGNAEACIIDVEGEYDMVSQRGFIFDNDEGNESVLSDLTIINGVADAPCPDCDGGGVYTHNSSPTISNVTFIGNFAAAGGAIGSVGGSPVINDCRFSDNEAFNGGALYFFENCSATVTGCLIYRNLATMKGGAISAQSNPVLVNIINCTISNNQAPAGGGIESWESEFDILNTIISFNGEGEAIFLYESPNVTFAYSDIFGNTGGDWIGDISDQLGIDGNISDDPLYADTVNNDFNLTVDSPCINAGDPDSPQDPDGSRADMGALFFDLNAAVDDNPYSHPVRISLSQNYPNPFNAYTTITYSVPEPTHITLKVYDMLGREVQTLIDGYNQAGSNTVLFDASGLSSGVYFYRLKIGQYLESKRLLLLK
ncbi:MAG: T9SS type A sorting domain-containing protein [candidate division Zixibacteria bacterium]|nr:T9SS type A sorting domain-containing protein [candidate division Zixibacteria bacterium]